MSGQRRCPGCRRLVGHSTWWCAVCDLRLPADLRDATQAAEQALHRARLAGERWLVAHPAASDRDLDILTLVAQGARTEEIAERLLVSPHTVRDHLRRMSTRWGCRGRAALVATAFRLGYLKIHRRGEEAA